MKHYFTLLALLFISCSSLAQRKQCVFAEALGASTTFGVSYDTRFNSHTNWGGRVGVAYTNSHSDDFFQNSTGHTTGWTLPVAVNYLFGRKDHHVELGLGVSFGQYTYKNKEGKYTVERDRSGTFGFFDIGYRYQSENGITVRAGLNPGFKFDDDHGVDRDAVIYPYVSIGYSF